MNIDERVENLEKGLRRWKSATMLLLTLVFVCGAIGASSAGRSKVSAESFELIDSTGKQRGLFAVENGYPVFKMMIGKLHQIELGGDDKNRGAHLVVSNGYANFSVIANKGLCRADMNALKGGGNIATLRLRTQDTGDSDIQLLKSNVLQLKASVKAGSNDPELSIRKSGQMTTMDVP